MIRDMKCDRCHKLIDPPWEYAKVCLDIIPDADNDGRSNYYEEYKFCSQCTCLIRDLHNSVIV